MLEVKDLYREYKPKKGEPVVALNHVSVKFPDKGLVFILGKSGSGKSTLLNVMGGLDKADGGDIIIKGKSSKNFKQGDFDSYRNTYLGFIFQEYNILDEFNVGQNIALAIELQGKKATSEEINRILEEVDLKGYGSRKTNELSGGQKQRVAIARALVKDPDIIFGDEPTGALDSKTGLAVFDTLKKLAQKKLVIVVSHDREFAELYGDRVIELADGKIISDIEKVTVAGDKKSEGVTLIDQSVLRVEKDYELTDEDMAVIKKYLNEKKDQERLISLDDSVNGAFKRITRIDDFGNKESFRATDESAIVNKDEEFRAIKSKLSLRKCFRIGGSSLKTKPFRLLITIVLAITAFAMFGLADTMGSYDKVMSTTKSIKDLSNDAIALEKSICYKWDEDDKYFSRRTLASDDSDLEILKQKYNLDFQGVYSLDSNNDSLSFYNNIGSTGKDMYGVTQYVSYASGLYVSNFSNVTSLGYEINGSYPSHEGEVAITRMMYETFKKYGYVESDNNKSYDKLVKLEANDVTENNIIGNTLSFYSNGYQKLFKITGIIDTHFDRSGYSKLDETASGFADGIGLYMLKNQFDADYKYSYSSLLFTNQATIDSLNISNSKNVYGEVESEGNRSSFNYVSKIADDALYIGAKPMYNWQIAVSFNAFNSDDFRNALNVSISPVTAFDIIYGQEMTVHDYTIDRLSDAVNYLYNGHDFNQIYELLVKKNDAYVNNLSYNDFIKKLRNSILTPSNLEIMGNVFSTEEINMSLRYNDFLRYREKTVLDNEKVTVVGLVFDEQYSGNVYLSDALYDSIESNNGKYSFVIANNPKDDSLIKKMVEDTYKELKEDEINYIVQNAVMPAYESINELVENLAQVFLYVGIGFAVFASLMLFNFITISISYKKREIGILRAVGARSKDVFNIFFAESFIIAMIAYTFAIITTFIVSSIINNSLVSEYFLKFTLLTPGIRQILLVLAVSIGVAFISTFIPVYKIAMKRPIDAIRDR